MSAYLDRVLSGVAPSPQEWNEHLRAVHRIFPDAMAIFLETLRTSEGETTYDYTARRLREEAPEARAFLDLGCGDGTLLSRLSVVFGDTVTLAGIDMSEESLARAGRNVSGAQLFCGDAARMEIGTSIYDAIVAHLSLLSMAQTEIVVSAVYRALTAGGTFLVVTEDPLSNDTIMQLMIAALGALVERTGQFGPRVPERAPLERDDDLLDVLHCAGFSQGRIERFDLRATLSADQLWELVRLSYPFALLDESLQACAGAAARKRAEELAANNRVDAHMTLRLVCASKNSSGRP